jgi:hypothetical protein
MWEVLSSDYDTQSSYYGEKQACEPLHVQLDLATDAVEVVNTTPQAVGTVRVTADVFSLDNKSLLHKEAPAEVPLDGVVQALHLELGPLEKDAVVLVKLGLKDQGGNVVSSNLYWLTAESQNYRELTRLAAATVMATATSKRAGDLVQVHVELRNTSAAIALQNKLTLVKSSDGSRILPVYYSDNYVSLLPGESREIDLEYPLSAAGGATPQLALRGFNLPQRTVPVGAAAQ